MKRLLKTIFIGACLALSAQQVIAEDIRYVTDELSTYLRRGAGDDYRISGSIKSGEKVTVLNQKDKYSQIRDSRNRDAWILTSELTKEASPKEQEALLSAEKQEIIIRWFIYGGSVMLVGLLLGLILPNIIPRRRRRNDGWA